MTEAEKMKHCHGCRDDFYNDKNPLGVKKCWGLKTAKMVKGFQIGTWTVPTEKGAFRHVKQLNCWHAQGVHFYDKLPSFVQPKDVRGAPQ